MFELLCVTKKQRSVLRPCQFNITFIFTLSNDRESQDGEETENQDRFHYQREESGLSSDDLSLSGVGHFWMVFIGRPW